jgi:hypothetical protein
MRAVGSRAVAAPAVLAISDDDRMFLMERLIGETDINDDPDPSHRAIRDDFVITSRRCTGSIRWL